MDRAARPAPPMWRPAPPPTGYDPRGFAVGVLTTQQLQRLGLRLTQFRWDYGSVSSRESPFQPHRELAGRFMQLDGTLDGWWPGDHRGCACGPVPVFRRTRT